MQGKTILMAFSLDQLITDFFTSLRDSFSWATIVILIAGITIGIVLSVSVYGVLTIASLKLDKKYKNMIYETSSIDDEKLRGLISDIKKEFKDSTAGFTSSEKIKVLGNTLFDTINVIAGEYYPESKYPLYELTIDELLQFMHYLSDRINMIFDKRLLRPFKQMSISQLFRFLDTKKKIDNNKVLKTAKNMHLGRASRFFLTALNYANPVYWFKHLIMGGTVATATNKIALIIIDIVADETSKTYSKRIFNQEIRINKEKIEQALEELDTENEEGLHE